MMRKLWGLAASSIRCRNATSAFAGLSKSCEMTTAARVPRSPSRAIRPGISAGGEAMTARSAVSGRSETERYASTPCTAVSRACTGITGPSNSPRNRFCANTRPIERGALLAPNSAIARGRNRNSRLRTDTPISPIKARHRRRRDPRSWHTFAAGGRMVTNVRSSLHQTVNLLQPRSCCRIQCRVGYDLFRQRQ
jgi:hypothetical protein